MVRISICSVRLYTYQACIILWQMVLYRTTFASYRRLLHVCVSHIMLQHVLSHCIVLCLVKRVLTLCGSILFIIPIMLYTMLSEYGLFCMAQCGLYRHISY